MVGKGDKIRFWQDIWCGQMSLQNQFPHIYAIAKDKTTLLENAYGASTPLVWDVSVTRNLQDWEVMEYENLLQLLADVKAGTEPDRLNWKLCKKRLLYSKIPL